MANGVAFFLNHPVTAIAPAAGGYQVTAGDAVFSAQVVVNAAGPVQRPGGRHGGGPGIPHLPPAGESTSSWTRSPRGSSPCRSIPPPGREGAGIPHPPPSTGTFSWAPAPNTSTPWRTLPPTQPVLDRLFQEAQLLPSLNRRQIIGAYAGPAAQAGPRRRGATGTSWSRGQTGVC